MAISFSLTDKQREAKALISQTAIHIMLFGGSRSGKTFLLVLAVVNRALAASESRHAILRFRFNHVKATIVNDTFPKVMKLVYPHIEYRMDKTDYYAEFPNQSQIWFSGLDDKDRTEKILGAEYATIYLNECSQIPYSSRHLAVTRLAQRAMVDATGHPLNLKLFYDCNPPTQAHWSYKLFKEKKQPEAGSKDLLPDPDNYISLQMNPEDNLENLPDSYIDTLKGLPERLRKRFLLGQFIPANENALFSIETIEAQRWVNQDLPDMLRVIVAVDPSGSDSEENDGDMIGIVVMGLGTDSHAYLLEDLTMKGTPEKWGKVAVNAFERHDADRIVAEKNYGGGMVRSVLQTAKRNVPYKAVDATRGKVVRAEPISALMEQGMIRFAGHFPELEDELLDFTTTGYQGEKSPNRADAFVWAATELFPALLKREKKKDFRGSGLSKSWQS